MMLAYHLFVTGGLVIAVILLALAVRDQVKLNRWLDENFDLGEYQDDDTEPELTEFEQEVADLTDDTLG